MYELIQDPELRRDILTHPLIGLIKIPPDVQRRAVSASEALDSAILQRTVTYISPQIFTELLLDRLNGDLDYALFAPLQTALEGAPNDEGFTPVKVTAEKLIKTGNGFMTLTDQVSALPESEFKTKILVAMREISTQLSAIGIDPGDNIPWLLGVRNLTTPVLRSALETLIQTADSAAEARHNIETWFNTEMDRATATFRTSMTIISFLLGLVIAILLNIDSLHITRILWEDPSFRDAVSNAAQTVDLAALQEQVAAAEEQIASEETSGEEIAAAIGAVSSTLENVTELQIPIGWSFAELTPVEDEQLTTRNVNSILPWANDDWFGTLIVKIMGLGATVIAVAQGAPFWFGILRQLSGGSTG